MDQNPGHGHDDRAGFGARIATALELQPDGAATFRCPFDDACEHFGGRLRFEAPVASLRQQLAYEIDLGGRSLAPADWFIGGGDWRPWLKPVREQPIARTIARLAAADGDFRSSRRFQRAATRIGQGRSFRRQHGEFNSVADLEDYYTHLSGMLSAARRYGILPRPSTTLESSLQSERMTRPAWLELSERNIGAGIGADGALVRVGPGKHRLGVAIALDLPSVPCELRLVHKTWLTGAMAASADPAKGLADAIARFAAEQESLAETARLRAEATAQHVLREALAAARADGATFFMARDRVPPHIGGRLLTILKRSMLRGVLNAPAGLFLGRGRWSGLISRLSLPALPAATPVPPWRAPPAAVASGPRGEIYLRGPEHPLPELFMAELTMFHRRFLGQHSQPNGVVTWQSIARAARAIIRLAGSETPALHELEGAHP